MFLRQQQRVSVRGLRRRIDAGHQLADAAVPFHRHQVRAVFDGILCRRRPLVDEEDVQVVPDHLPVGELQQARLRVQDRVLRVFPAPVRGDAFLRQVGVNPAGVGFLHGALDEQDRRRRVHVHQVAVPQDGTPQAIADVFRVDRDLLPVRGLFDLCNREVLGGDGLRRDGPALRVSCGCNVRDLDISGLSVRCGGLHVLAVEVRRLHDNIAVINRRGYLAGLAGGIGNPFPP